MHYIGGDDNPPAQRTLERWQQAGDGPQFVRVGRAVRYRQSDLDAWLECRTRTSTSDQRSLAPLHEEHGPRSSRGSSAMPALQCELPQRGCRLSTERGRADTPTPPTPKLGR